MALQGIKIASFLMALTLATMTLGAAGWYATAGQGWDTGMHKDVKDVNSQVSNPSAKGVSSTSPGFFGIAVGVVRSLKYVGLLTGGIYGLIVSWGGPWYIALSVQTMTTFTVGLTLLAVFRAFGLIN